MNIVILSGGVGTRLWPLGRKNNPKQFFPMISKQPLIKETYQRFVKRYGKKHIFFSVTADLLAPLRRLFPALPREQFIVEPSRRDTAPAMGFVAAYLALRFPDEPMVFVPSDHFVGDLDSYLACFETGEKLIQETGKMIDIGIAATFPSTVLGYTKIAAPFQPKGKGPAVYHFAGHTEKPDYATALKYLSDGQYLWHGNYYMWTPAKFLGAFERYAPAMHQTLFDIMAALKGKQTRRAAKLYETLPKISFDYAITEKIDQKDVLIIKGDFGWSDVGAWDMVFHQLRGTADNAGNVVKGNVVHVDTQNCLFLGHPKKLLATVGLKNVAIIDTPDALLVCPLERAQEVKKLFPEIKKRGLKKHL